VIIVGHHMGGDSKRNRDLRLGVPDGYRKALRTMNGGDIQPADSLLRGDTGGYPGRESEKDRGIAKRLR
jgi:acetyl-CoA carboxylase alpha subunit